MQGLPVHTRVRTWFAAQPRALRLLLLINGCAYLFWQIFLVHFEPIRDFVWSHLALNPGLPGILFEPWQIVTYGFLHLQTGLGGLLHVLFNMLWLVWIGRDLEDLQGPGRLFGLYILGAVGGAVLTVALNAAFPGLVLFSARVHGASAAVLAVMAGIGVLYPHKQIALFLLGPIRVIHLVAGFLLLDMLFLAAGGTSVSAHLGGALTGIAFARLQLRGADLTSWADALFFGSRPGRARKGASTGRQSVLATLEARLAGRGARASEGEAVSRPARTAADERGGSTSGDGPEGAGEIDRILDKISESGYDSLSADEKRTLYEASR